MNDQISEGSLAVLIDGSYSVIVKKLFIKEFSEQTSLVCYEIFSQDGKKIVTADQIVWPLTYQINSLTYQDTK